MNRKFIAKELLLLAKSIISSFDNMKRFQNGLVNYAEENGVQKIQLDGYGWVDVDEANDILYRKEREVKGLKEAIKYADQNKRK